MAVVDGGARAVVGGSRVLSANGPVREAPDGGIVRESDLELVAGVRAGLRGETSGAGLEMRVGFTGEMGSARSLAISTVGASWCGCC